VTRQDRDVLHLGSTLAIRPTADSHNGGVPQQQALRASRATASANNTQRLGCGHDDVSTSSTLYDELTLQQPQKQITRQPQQRHDIKQVTDIAAEVKTTPTTNRLHRRALHRPK
jgi:hypothetical protein